MFYKKNEDTKLERSINCSQMKLLNFEDWSSGGQSNIGHHSRKVVYKIDVIKKYAPKFIFFNEKKLERFE